MGDQDYFGDMAVRSSRRCHQLEISVHQLKISVGGYFTPHQMGRGLTWWWSRAGGDG